LALYPTQAQDWAFPADSEPGHVSETKKDRDTLSKRGNDLGQTFRTIATGAGVSEFDAEFLMNHAVPGAMLGTLRDTSFLKIIYAASNKP
jgi:hypothetical protein